MAKQAARGKPGAKRDVAWPAAAAAFGHCRNDSGAAAAEAAFSRIGKPRSRKRNARNSASDAERDAAIAMGEALTSGFSEAVQTAIHNAHAEGLAVPVRVSRIAAEISPDGKLVPVDDQAPWSPVDWRNAATR
jgi:hypothetical protein